MMHEECTPNLSILKMLQVKIYCRFKHSLYFKVIHYQLPSILNTTFQLTSFVTGAPGKGREVGNVHEDVEEVVERPGHHDHVVNVLKEHHHDGGVTHSLNTSVSF